MLETGTEGAKGDDVKTGARPQFLPEQTNKCFFKLDIDKSPQVCYYNNAERK